MVTDIQRVRKAASALETEKSGLRFSRNALIDSFASGDRALENRRPSSAICRPHLRVPGLHELLGEADRRRGSRASAEATFPASSKSLSCGKIALTMPASRASRREGLTRRGAPPPAGILPASAAAASSRTPARCPAERTAAGSARRARRRRGRSAEAASCRCRPQSVDRGDDRFSRARAALEQAEDRRHIARLR